MSTQTKEWFCIHGFSFESAEERQAVAEGHDLWPDYLKYWNDHCGYIDKPDMNDDMHRELFEFYIEGAFREWKNTCDRQNAVT